MGGDQTPLLVPWRVLPSESVCAVSDRFGIGPCLSFQEGLGFRAWVMEGLGFRFMD